MSKNVITISEISKLESVELNKRLRKLSIDDLRALVEKTDNEWVRNEVIRRENKVIRAWNRRNAQRSDA